MSIAKLPTELDTRIIGLLKNHEDVHRLSMTSKYYHRISEPLLYRVVGFSSTDAIGAKMLLLTLMKWSELSKNIKEIVVYTGDMDALDTEVEFPKHQIVDLEDEYLTQKVEPMVEGVWDFAPTIKQTIESLYPRMKTQLKYRWLDNITTIRNSLEACVDLIATLANNLEVIDYRVLYSHDILDEALGHYHDPTANPNRPFANLHSVVLNGVKIKPHELACYFANPYFRNLRVLRLQELDYNEMDWDIVAEEDLSQFCSHLFQCVPKLEELAITVWWHKERSNAQYVTRTPYKVTSPMGSWKDTDLICLEVDTNLIIGDGFEENGIPEAVSDLTEKLPRNVEWAFLDYWKLPENIDLFGQLLTALPSCKILEIQCFEPLSQSDVDTFEKIGDKWSDQGVSLVLHVDEPSNAHLQTDFYTRAEKRIARQEGRAPIQERNEFVDFMDGMDDTVAATEDDTDDTGEDSENENEQDHAEQEGHLNQGHDAFADFYDEDMDDTDADADTSTDDDTDDAGDDSDNENEEDHAGQDGHLSQWHVEYSGFIEEDMDDIDEESDY
ncbi:hypothetical protein BU23DRAFT_566630 [Bimuria novae-zelandiae CBS 107.79]|uniref:Uncharacterized protein n=1 Tax=Bimuria novae-zelandiae CBS 107.79 TaxID=1447943 RepID=A0A6A5VKK1_9PLEO|nr:hypothetical protein BU23DRAFT_566630 [Bimuria novae-zelandiae CBS 107.79]